MTTKLSRLEKEAGPAGLSPRQIEVLGLLAKGLTNQEIGGALRISTETVRTHLTEIFARLGVTNRTEAAAAYLGWDAGTERVAAVLARPAIAVLPLLTGDDEARARTTAQGLTRDLVVQFSRWCWFPVIAHSSTQDVRSLGDTNQALGARLGARFLVDGMLRSVAEALRLSVLVIDAESGCALWSENYDIPRADLFTMLDEVCRSIVASVYPLLISAVRGRLSRANAPTSVDAWELAQHAFIEYEAREQAANVRAERDFSAALAREPTLVLAHYGLGLVAFDRVLNQWSPTGDMDREIDRVALCADRCRALAPHLAEGYYLDARHWQARGDHRRAVGLLKEAIGRNPSYAAAHILLAQTLLTGGELEEGSVRMQQACRLGPRSFVAGLAVLHFVRREFQEALSCAERALASNPRYTFARALAAASAYWVEERTKALGYLDSLERFDVSTWQRTFGTNVGSVADMAEALRALRALRGH